VEFGDDIEEGAFDRPAATLGENSHLHISDLAIWSVGCPNSSLMTRAYLPASFMKQAIMAALNDRLHEITGKAIAAGYT
jgi:hypothetical protein